MADSRPLLDPQALARLRHLPLCARRPMEGAVSGHHKSPHRGSSVEFAEYRNYAPGDDIRRLDWRVFARTDRFYLKEFEAETNLRLYLVLDCSASMKFGEPHPKIDYARRLAATFAYLAAHQGDATGLICAGKTTVAEVPPRRNPAHLKVICDALEKTEAKGPTGLPEALHRLADTARRRAMVIVLSDFFCDLEPLLDAVRHLRFEKHDVALFQLLDRAELDFRFDRPARFVDLESSFSLATEPAAVREQYLRELNAFLGRLRAGCQEFGAEHAQVATDQTAEQAAATFLAERARWAAAA